MQSLTALLKSVYTWSRTVVPDKYRNKWAVFMIVIFGVSLDEFSATACIATTDSIQRHFITTYATASWIVSVYALTIGSFIILFGKLSDILGPHNIFILGVNIFWICALISATVDSVYVVIVFRAIQGIGGAALVPASYALAGNYFYTNGKHLVIALSLIFMTITSSMGLGGIIGGAFAATTSGYKGLFYFIFAFSFVISILAIFFLVPAPKTEEHRKLKVKNIDFIGMFLFIVGSLLVILGLTEGGDNWKSPKAYVPLPVGFVMIVISMIWELVYIQFFKNKLIEAEVEALQDDEKAKKFVESKIDWRAKLETMFPLEALKVHDYVLFTTGGTLYYLWSAFVISLTLQYDIYVEGNLPIIAGLKIVPYVIGILVAGATIDENMMIKIGAKMMLVFSSLLSVGGYVILTRETFEIKNGYWKFSLPGLFLFGVGNSIFFKYFFVKIFPEIPVHLQGIASGICQSFAQIAFSVGNALLASVIGKIELAETFEMKKRFSDRFVIARYIGFGIAGVIFLISLFMGIERDTSSPEFDAINKAEIKFELKAKNDDEPSVL